MRISFSSFTFQNIFNFINVGYQLIKNQNIETVDEKSNVGMNSFFLYWSKMFFARAKETIISFMKEKCSRKIIIQGMSMGGAMSQCFYYHLKNSTLPEYNVSVMAFGSPRIGNNELRNWFLHVKADVINYSICVEVDGKLMGDPVCYFPTEKRGYVNNYNLTIKNSNEVYCGYFHNMDSDTDVSFKNFCKEWTFIKKEDLKIWQAVHNFEEYKTHV
jgi:hypothetical protein